MLPQFGFTELLLVAGMSLIILGPKELPRMMHRLGRLLAKAKGVANEFRQAFDDIAHQSEIENLRADIETLKRDNAVTQAVEDMKNTEKDINARIMRQSADAGQPSGSTGKTKKDSMQ